MATGRKTVVVGQTIDPDTWGNPLWDQSVQTFASAADRTSQFPSPKLGAVSFLEDTKRLYVCTVGGAAPTWTVVATGPAVRGDVFTGQTSASGVVTFPHGLGQLPKSVVVSLAPGNPNTVIQVAQVAVTTWDATNVTATVIRADTGAALGSNNIVLGWVATGQ